MTVGIKIRVHPTTMVPKSLKFFEENEYYDEIKYQ